MAGRVEGATGSPKVVIAIESEALRARIRAALAGRGFVIVADTGDAASASVAAEQGRPDLCLVGVDPSGDGLAAVAQIAARMPETTIIAVAAVESPTQMIAALERGASGYVSAETGDEELATMLRAALGGEPAVSRSLVPHLIDQLRRGSPRRLVLPDRTIALTLRESDVAELVQAGLPTAEIARRLGLSPVTVRRHISGLLKKTGARSRDALAETLKKLER